MPEILQMDALQNIMCFGLGLSRMRVNFTEICSGSEAGSFLRPIDFAYLSPLDLRVMKKKKHTAVGDRVGHYQLRVRLGEPPRHQSLSARVRFKGFGYRGCRALGFRVRRVSFRVQLKVSKPCTLKPTPYTLHPSPYTLPPTLHPTPYTLHPDTYTLHPTP